MKTRITIITAIILITANAFAQDPLIEIDGFLDVKNPQEASSISVGWLAGQNITTGGINSFFGSQAGQNVTTGGQNCFFGNAAGFSTEGGGGNSLFGASAGGTITSGSFNTFLGLNSGFMVTTQSKIVAIGVGAGPETLGSGENERLFIDVERTNSPLIYGEFDNDLLRVNGTLQIGERNYNGFNNAGVLRSPPLFDADLYIVSSDNVYVEIGENAGQSGTFEIWNGPDLSSTTTLQTAAFKVDEAGNVSAKGAINGSSDINRKESFLRINTKKILDKISKLRITEWQYKGSADRHIGPMAQDFYAAFGLGQGETTIATVDADGVALAAIQALNEKLESEEARNDQLENEVMAQKIKNEELEKRLTKLERLITNK